MGKKARLKELRRELRSSPELVRLLGDYFEAKDELEKGRAVVSFRGQLATDVSIETLLFEEGNKLDIPGEQIYATVLLSMNGILP